MNIYKYLMKRKKRGSHCLFIARDNIYGCLCGCGCRFDVKKNYKKRIIRRYLKNNLLKELEQMVK